MANSCSIDAHIKNSQGEVVKSKLWKDLMKFTNNKRDVAKKFYSLATDKSFLDMFKDSLSYDDNDQVTFKSFQKVINSYLKDKDLSDDSVYKKVRDSFRASNLSVENAVDSVQSFNKSSAFKDSLLAIVIPKANGLCDVDIVFNNRENRNKLKDFFKKKDLGDYLISQLKKLYVNTDFIETITNSSNYSLQDIDKLYGAADTLIRIARGISLDDYLKVPSKELGSFVIKALGKDNSLIKRLANALTDDIVNRYEGASKDVVMESLIGDLFYENLSDEIKQSNIGKILLKISNNIKTKLEAGDNVKLETALARVDELATSKVITQSDEPLNSVVNSTIKNNRPSEIYEDTKRMLSLRQTLIDELFKVDKKTGKKAQEKLDEIKKKLEGHESLDNTDLKFVYNTAKLLIHEIRRDVNEVEMNLDLHKNDSRLSLKNMAPMYGNMYYEAGIKLKYDNQCLELANNLLRSINFMQITGGTEETAAREEGELRGLINGTINKLSQTRRNLHVQEVKFVANVLGEVYGADVVPAFEAYVLDYSDPEDIKSKKKLIKKSFDERTMIELIENEKIESDLDFVEFFLQAPGRTHDIVAQLLSKIIDTVNAQADHETIECISEINKIRLKYNFKRKQILELFEDFANGDKTGYFISPVHWGNYLKEKKKEEDKIKTEFKKYVEDKSKQKIENIPYYIRNAMYAEYKNKRMKKWHEGVKKVQYDADGNPIVVNVNAHSIYDKASGTYSPNIEYKDKNGNQIFKNEKYDKLTTEQKNCLNEILSIKKELDSKLPSGSTVLERCPQIEHKHVIGVIFNTVVEKGQTFRKFIIDKYFNRQNIDDSEFGNDITVDTKDKWYGKDYVLRKTRLNEIPFFFIKPLKNPNFLWTDIYSSLASYSSMAYSYNALKGMRNTIEVIATAASRRNMTDRSSWIDRFLDPAYKRADLAYSGVSLDSYYNTRAARNIRDMLERNLYSKRAPSLDITSTRKIVINKLLDKLSRLTTIMFLGGNLHGAAVNDATGFNEIWKEAFVGEDLDLKSCGLAHKDFLEYMTKYIFNYAWHHVPNDKISAWFRWMNTRGDNAFQFKNMDMARKTPVSIYDLVMSPYTLGDLYMQGVSYLATSRSNKLYTKDGKTISMFDAYEQKGDIFEVPSETYFTSQELAEDYETLKSLYEHIQTNPLITGYRLSEEERALLSKYNISTKETETDFSNISIALEQLFDTNIAGSWKKNGVKTDTQYEINYMRKCRQLNDRMHGIYNKANKTVIYSSTWGQLLMAFKGYLLGYVERDWASGRYDITLGRYVEGKYRTVGKQFRHNFSKTDYDYSNFLTQLVGGLGRCALDVLISTAMPVLNRTSKGNTWFDKQGNLNKEQINNMTRVGMQIDLVVMLELLSLLFKKLAQGDDESSTKDDNRFWWVMYYITNRALFEQNATTLLLGGITAKSSGERNSWIAEAGRQTSIVPVSISALMSLEELARLFVVGSFTSGDYNPDLEWSEYSSLYRGTHVGRNSNLTLDESGMPIYSTAFSRALHGEAMAHDPKYWKALISITPFLKSWKVWFHGKEAYENWLYGNTTRSR